MAIFKRGDRVRILYSVNWPELAGQEGTVIEVGAASEIFGRIVFGALVVAPDAWGTSRAPRKGDAGCDEFGPLPNQVEPILRPPSAADMDAARDLLNSLETSPQAVAA